MALASQDFNWRKKYKTLEEYYKNEFDPQYYTFDKWQLQIDPMETLDEINQYDAKTQKLEIAKCHASFPYFCHKYVKILHPKKGLIPFIIYNYQRRAVNDYEKYRFNIISKFRQGGLTTLTALWCMWRCLFKFDETFMILSKSDREAIAVGEIVKKAVELLPTWLQPQMEKNNDHEKTFDDTGCKMLFYTPEAARSRSITYLILDEAAFIPNMEKHWKAMFPTIATGGHCICISTVNGVGNWYYDVYMGAKRGTGYGSQFHVIELDYWEHPEYNNPEWERQMRAQLGEEGWLQEVCRDFLGSSESYIPTDIINELDEATKNIKPTRRLFKKWQNPSEVNENRYGEFDEEDKGALYIWKEPVEGREYIIGVDAAEGMGGENDNSCFQVIDAVTCEQCAEFYSNICPPYEFAQIVATVGRMYNTALIVVEAMGIGLSVLERLQYELEYENIFMSQTGAKKGTIIPGVRMNRSLRPKIIETIQTRLINRSMVVRSRRLVRELKGFRWNAKSKKPEASPGFHDDAILAMCLALYAKDIQDRSSPIVLGEKPNHTESYKAKLMEEIKKELEKDTEENEEIKLIDNILKDDEDDDNPYFETGYVRPNDAILKEFGW